MDRSVLFQKATLAICGNLEIEQAMADCVATLRDHVPVDRIFVQVYESELGAMRTIAMASSDRGEKLDTLTPMPEQARTLVRTHLSQVVGGAVAIDSPERNPVAAQMLKHHGLEGWSVLRLIVSVDGGHIGAVVLGAEGTDRYREEHAQLVKLLHKPFAIALANTLKHREVQRLRDMLADDNRFLHRELQKIRGDEIVGSDFGLKEVMGMVRQVAPTDSPVLITGETGVGKEVVARAIHQGSERRRGPFIAVNCGAISDTLLDSELFGHEKGAFTGAIATKRGRFERANKGTIFLDEIGEMPLSAQVRLLRVLQNREVERIGGTERIPLDIRVLAATHRDLQSLVGKGQFREDLWFRVNVFPLEIPPLRQRRADIPALVQHFAERKARDLKLREPPSLAPGAIEQLLAYSWPGNVRELENLVERAMILHRGEPLRFDLGRADDGARKRGPCLAEESAAIAPLHRVIEEHIRRALDRSGGKIHGSGGAGELLGINPNTLRAKMRKLGIPFGAQKRSPR